MSRLQAGAEYTTAVPLSTDLLNFHRVSDGTTRKVAVANLFESGAVKFGDAAIASATQLFGAGTTSTRYAMGTTANEYMVGLFGETTATSGDSRNINARLYFSGAGVSGETLRAFSIVNGVTAATGGTVNGAHISLSVNGAAGTVSGAGNALRCTLGYDGTNTTPGGTMSVIQVDSDVASGVTLPAGTAFLRFTNTNSVKLNYLARIPNASNGTIFAAHTTDAISHSIRCITEGGTTFYIMCTTTATNRS